MAPSLIDTRIRVTYAGGVRAPEIRAIAAFAVARTRHNQLALAFQPKGRDRDGHSGRSTIETIHEVRLKQFCARVRDGLSKPVNPRGAKTSRRTCHASGSFLSHLSQARKARIATARHGGKPGRDAPRAARVMTNKPTQRLRDFRRQ
jgi:hypothetical protein